jgi:23S rRNA pseudouridine1911/1915/1917 synthase
MGRMNQFILQGRNKMKNYNIKIIFEDNHLLVVEKPINVPTQEDSTGDKDLLTILKEDLKIRHNKPGNVFLGLVHRLDRPVGGIMVFAKTSKAASRLSEQIRNKNFRKVYLAVIHGSPKESSGTLMNYLLKDNTTNIVSVVEADVDGAKQASLDYEVLKSKDNLSLIRINLHTGRSHQIRVQFAASGNPLYGDQKYGAGLNKPGQQIALWAEQISFEHPTTKEGLVFTCKHPDVLPWNLF